MEKSSPINDFSNIEYLQKIKLYNCKNKIEIEKINVKNIYLQIKNRIVGHL